MSYAKKGYETSLLTIGIVMILVSIVMNKSSEFYHLPKFFLFVGGALLLIGFILHLINTKML